MAPASVASFMVSLFPVPVKQNMKLLDPGAGVGTLTSSFVEHLCKSKAAYHVDVSVYEIDPVMRFYLQKNLDLCKETSSFTVLTTLAFLTITTRRR